VERDDPVRVIEAFVCGLDLLELGFQHAGYDGGPGQPPYAPADLLKLYLYGYLNRVRSSRNLAREAERNLEVIWLLKALRPGYRTIASFRSSNCTALKAANRQLVVLMRELGLVSAKLVAIDGAFFHGDASKASIKSRKRLEAELVAIDRDIEAYHREVEANDAQEEAHSSSNGAGGRGGGDMADKVAALMEKRARTQSDLKRLEQSGEAQLPRTDADARLLSKSGQVVSECNVQIAVDERHKLIVASEVVNDGNDTGQLYEMAKAAKEALGVETLEVVADAGYFDGPALVERTPSAADRRSHALYLTPEGNALPAQTVRWSRRSPPPIAAGMRAPAARRRHDAGRCRRARRRGKCSIAHSAACGRVRTSCARAPSRRCRH